MQKGAEELCFLSGDSYDTPPAPVAGPFLVVLLILFLQIPINCTLEPPFYIFCMAFIKI